MENERDLTRAAWLVVAALTIAATLVIALFTGGSPIHAIPQPEHTFGGRVIIETGPNTTSAGLSLEARIGNVNYARSNSTGRNTSCIAQAYHGSPSHRPN